MKGKPLILAVDSNRYNLELLIQFLEPAGFRVQTAANLEKLDQKLGSGSDIAAVLVDVSGFGRALWERCERLRARGIPFLLLSPKQSSALQSESIAAGASGLLVKPLAVKDLIAIIRTLLET